MDSGYVVLARRYRPSQFGQVIGQGHVAQTLQNAIEGQRVHHAYLFTGSRGVGKTTVARIMAKALNCDTAATATPCDTCDSCVEVRDGRSVDVYEIDGASHTGVDDVRELRESVRYLPARSRQKIYIIDEVHMLSTSAFNALLKTLEEPPAHVVFIFATTEPHKIPATILSRCQRFDFKRVPGPVLADHLARICQQEGIEVERAGLNLIARAAEGSVRDSLSLLDQLFAYAAGQQQISTEKVAEVLGVADRRVLFALSRALLARQPQQALAIVDRLFTSGQDLSQFAQAFLVHLRDLTVVHTCKDPAPLVDATESELADMEQLCAAPEAGLLPMFFDRFCRTAEQIARSAFPRLLLEMAIIEMVHAEPMLPLGDLLERLEELEQRLGSSPGGAPRGGSGPGQRPRFSRGPDTSAPRKSRLQLDGDRPPAPARQAAPARQTAPARQAAPARPAPARQAAPARPAPARQAAPTSQAAPAPTSQAAPAPTSQAASARQAAKTRPEPRPPEASSPAPTRPEPQTRPEATSPAPTPKPQEPRPPATGRKPHHHGRTPAITPPTNGNAMDTWQRLLQGVEGAHPEAAGPFFMGTLLDWSGDTIRVAYPRGSFQVDLASGKLSTFTAECCRLVGQKVEVTIEQLDAESLAAAGGSSMESQAHKREERSRRRRDEAAAHPVIQAVQRELGGVIQSITTKAE